MKTFRKLAVMGLGILALLMVPAGGRAQAPEWRHAPPDAAAAAAPRTLAPYFTPATAQPMAPDADGFLRRWMLLEPIVKPNRTNTVFTGTYVRNALNTEYFPDQFAVLPHNGEKVTVAGQQLAWHALDSTGFNVKLFRFAYGLDKPTYGVLFWAVTVVNSPREMKNVRLAVGSNSASMWWLNGEDVADLFDDRRMVMDDVVSKRLTLNKGKNVLRGAVINGPGMSDFCVRFVDENENPIKNLTLSLP
ncbi:MAG TPA: acetylxylan esterase [Verrucomicrobiae bacterium]|nr:acetylxylan esterase [Verrucomicrobiae bacterium]